MFSGTTCFSRPYVRLVLACISSRTCASVSLNPIIRTSASGSVRPRTSMPIGVCVHESAFVCIHIIKSPDASACIISDASGRVFHSRTFETHYTVRVKIGTVELVYSGHPSEAAKWLLYTGGLLIEVFNVYVAHGKFCWDFRIDRLMQDRPSQVTVNTGSTVPFC